MKRDKVDQEPDYKSVDLKRLDRANIGARYFSARFDNIPDSAKHKTALTDYVSRLHLPQSHRDSCKSLLMHGPHGSGKTAAGSLVLVEVMARSPALVYFDLAVNIDHYAFHRDVTNDQGQPIWKLLTRDAQFLVLDDLGSAKDSDWTARWIETVLTERYHRLLTTIITTNVELDVLYERVPRLQHLVKEAYQTIEFDTINWRD